MPDGPPPSASARRTREPRLGLEQWLADCRERRQFDGKPWLLLGKGPTFARLRSEHREQFHTIGLNHVVREGPLTIAHAIDIDVVASCADALRTNCRFLLMPRVPHVQSGPGERALEEWFAELPVLDELDRDGRLVWYNLSTARARSGSPTIEVRHFSSEAAMQILGRLHARTVRSLGIDGGRGYSRSFADLDDTTRLANGQPLFDAQFAHLREIVQRFGVDYAPLAEPVRVSIRGGDEAPLAARVLEFSIRKHASMPVEIVDRSANATAPAGCLDLPAAAFVEGDVTQATHETPPTCLVDLGDERPWRDARSPRAERWLDLYAEAVDAGVVEPSLVHRAVRRGDGGPHLLRLPAPDGDDTPATTARRLQRELATMKLSATFRAGRAVLAPVRAVLRAFRG